MARRRAGTSRTVKRRRSPNYNNTVSVTRGVRRLVKSVRGQPGTLLKRKSSNSFRGIRTLMKRDESKGITQPEAKQALLASQAIVPGGVRVDSRSQGATVISKDKIVSPGRNTTKVRLASKGPLKRRNSGV